MSTQFRSILSVFAAAGFALAACDQPPDDTGVEHTGANLLPADQGPCPEFEHRSICGVNLTCRRLLAKAQTVPLPAGCGEYIFWTGPVNRQFADEYARASGKATLEIAMSRTADGQQLYRELEAKDGNPPKWQVSIWEVISQRFANQSCGLVNLWVDGADQTRMYWRVEKPILDSREGEGWIQQRFNHVPP